MWTYTTDSMDFVTVSTGLILPYWMGLPIRYIHFDDYPFEIICEDIDEECYMALKTIVKEYEKNN